MPVAASRLPAGISSAPADSPTHCVEIDKMKAVAVFDVAFAQVMQLRLPTRGMFQILGHMLGEEDVPGVPAIHYSLCDVNPGSGHVHLFIEVSDFVDRPAMNPH